MAQVIAILRLETDALSDAADSLNQVLRQLPKRHGEAFRTLERRILAAIDKFEVPESIRLEDGLHAMLAPKAWTALLVEARALGLTA